MPRLDLEDAAKVGLISDEEIEVEKREPGMFGPFDLCLSCYEAWILSSDVEHPPYEELDYPCMECGNRLTEEDDHCDT